MYDAGLLGSTASVSIRDASASCVRLLPVTVVDGAENKHPAPVAVSRECGVDRKAVVAPGSIEITLARAQVRITGPVDAGVLRVVLECLRG
jgi:hypothetical protein